MADPEQYNPPLTMVGHLWRTALCLVISAIAWGEVAPAQWSQAPGLFALDLAGGVAALALVFFRRRWPFPIAMATAVLSLVSLSAAGPSGLAFVSLCTHRRLPQIVVAGLTGVVTGQLFYYYQPVRDQEPPWLNFTFTMAATIALAAIGMYIGSRRELVWTLRERARQAESEQSLRVDQARSAERERIAREMHDVLAHRISLVAMHSGALAFRDDLPAEQVRETAALIQEKSHEALTDLRQVLGMLRDEDAPHRPQPTLRDLPELVEESRRSGLVVTVEDLIDTEPPAHIARTVYRIVQEALTNARKHGGGTTAHVRLEGGPGHGFDIVVRNPRRLGGQDQTAPVSGLGLVGLRERAELNGGWLSIEETHDSFTLTGWLPWPT
ncbi:MAG TPA: histidine kinase [Marmoricola sp.]|nr:histidine kinase [Marmoricola sp.]